MTSTLVQVKSKRYSELKFVSMFGRFVGFFLLLGFFLSRFALLLSLAFVVQSAAYMCGPIIPSNVLRDEAFPRTPAQVAERLAQQQSKVLAAASSDVLVYVDSANIVVQRGATVTDVFEMFSAQQLFFLADLKLAVLLSHDALNFIRFDSEFRNARSFSCDLPWQYRRDCLAMAATAFEAARVPPWWSSKATAQIHPTRSIAL